MAGSAVEPPVGCAVGPVVGSPEAPVAGPVEADPVVGTVVRLVAGSLVGPGVALRGPARGLALRGPGADDGRADGEAGRAVLTAGWIAGRVFEGEGRSTRASRAGRGEPMSADPPCRSPGQPFTESLVSENRPPITTASSATSGMLDPIDTIVINRRRRPLWSTKTAGGG